MLDALHNRLQAHRWLGFLNGGIAESVNFDCCSVRHCTLFVGFSGAFLKMQSVQRRFGKLLPRTADESQVAVLLKDFDDADRMLAKVLTYQVLLVYSKLIRMLDH